MGTSMSLETIIIVVVLAFATYYGARWLLIARARRNRRRAATLTDTEIDRLIERRDGDYERFMNDRELLFRRVLTIGAGLVLTLAFAWGVSLARDLPAPAAVVTIGWVVAGLSLALCIASLLYLLVRNLALSIRITEADQKVSAEMRAAALARRAER